MQEGGIAHNEVVDFTLKIGISSIVLILLATLAMVTDSSLLDSIDIAESCAYTEAQSVCFTSNRFSAIIWWMCLGADASEKCDYNARLLHELIFQACT